MGLPGSRLRPSVPAPSLGGVEPGPVAAYAVAANDGDGEEQVIHLACASTARAAACAAAPTGEVA